MLSIGRKGTDLVIAEILPVGYENITSVNAWLGVVEKLHYDPVVVYEQIELFYDHHFSNSTLTDWDRDYYNQYKRGNLIYR